MGRARCGVGVADYTGDGKIDIVWRKFTTGEDAIWVMNGVTWSRTVSVSSIIDPNWTIAGPK